VEATGYGDGFQAIFEKEPPGPNSDHEYDLENMTPYFLTQRRFEPPDDGKG
jgi:hypothetical protein